MSMAKCWKKGSNEYTEPTGLKQQQQQRNNEKRKQKPNKVTQEMDARWSKCIYG